MAQNEYAQAGVDYQLIEPFKEAMVAMAQTTLSFPNRRGVHVEVGAHGCTFDYRGPHQHLWSNTQEGLGNKNWIAELMYTLTGDARYFEGIGIDAALMIANDVIAQGAMPVVYTDEVAAGDSEWFQDQTRARALARGFYRVCEEVGMALAAGESPALRYLIKAMPLVISAPSLSGCVTGIIAPHTRLITGEKLGVGDRIIGIKSSGIHANGISLVIKRVMELPQNFLTPFNGHTLGDETLIPTRSYVALIEALLESGCEIHALLPGTGSGIGKIAFDKRPFTYRIHSWVDVPPLFQFMRELGVHLLDCLTTFNWGIGYYIFVPAHQVNRVLVTSALKGYDAQEIGVVEAGERLVIFEPEKLLILRPPGH